VDKKSYQFFINIALFLSLSQAGQASIENIDKESIKSQIDSFILLDASTLSNCQTESVKTAKCLPAETFQSDQNILASFYDITWVFGTAGLEGNEKLLVFADKAEQRDALIALLYLAGHSKVWRWSDSKSSLQNQLGKAKGQNRGIIRSKYYTAKMRDKNLVLRSEINKLRQKGWILSKENKRQDNPIIVYGKNPLDSLAKFTQLFINKTENEKLKILIFF